MKDRNLSKQQMVKQATNFRLYLYDNDDDDDDSFWLTKKCDTKMGRDSRRGLTPGHCELAFDKGRKTVVEELGNYSSWNGGFANILRGLRPPSPFSMQLGSCNELEFYPKPLRA